MNIKPLIAVAMSAAPVTVLSSTTIAQEPPPEAASLEKAFKEDSFSPHANRNFPSRDEVAVDLGEQEWYLRTERPDVRLYVREIGEGEPVVVLHGGWGAEHSYLLDLVEPLTDDRRFILYDQRGSLRSPAPDDAISLESFIDDIERLRVQLGRERIDVLAHSMGNVLALAYLNAHPDRVDRLVLVASPPASKDMPLDGGSPLASTFPGHQAWAERDAMWQEMERAGVHPRHAEARAFSDKDLTKQWRISYAAVNLVHVDRWRRLEGGQAFYNQQVANAIMPTLPDAYDYLPALAAHRRGATVVIGDHDFVDFGATYWKWVAARTPTLELSLIEQAGHACWIDAPEGVTAALRCSLVEGAS